MNQENIWKTFLKNIKTKIAPLSFDTWFKETKLHNIEEGKIIIIVPMNVHKKHLNDNYLDLIIETLNEVTGTNFEIEFILNEEIEKQIKNNILEKGVPYNNPKKANLNNNYSFDNFIVGESNFFAHAAAVSVAENPGKSYNPLFIYGNSGLGKTHLMQAIGNYIIKNTNKKVLYVTSENFISDFLNLNKKDKDGTNFEYIDYFKNKYRNIDILIIDDIQFLSGAPATQQEFFHTFNDLYNENKQIIISADRSPNDLKLLENRLITRFNWGLKVNIFPPDYQLRLDILKRKITNMKFGKPFNKEVLEYIANNFQSDIRQLEGALTRIFAYATMFNVEEINLNTAVESLKDYINTSQIIKNDIDKIKKIVAEFYKIKIDDLNSKRRTSNIAYPRQVAMYLARTLTNESYLRIGMEFGGKNHATVIHAFDKISKELKENLIFKKTMEKLIEQIKC
ncbi:MAG: chromosomal replication initiator protein DnaA [Bacilli bacterium]